VNNNEQIYHLNSSKAILQGFSWSVAIALLKTLLLILYNTVYCTVDCKKIEYIKSQKQIIYIIVLKIGKLVLLIFMMYSIFVQSTVRTYVRK
jgi:hypothetical protein